MSSALADGLFATEPPGKPAILFVLAVIWNIWEVGCVQASKHRKRVGVCESMKVLSLPGVSVRWTLQYEAS